MIEVVYQIGAYGPVASEIMSTQLSNILYMQSLIIHVDSSDEFRSIFAINSKRQLCIVIKTADCNLKATTHQYIRTAGLLTKSFCTDKSHLRYT